jgi:DME family drug/metabolite transporter
VDATPAGVGAARVLLGGLVLLAIMARQRLLLAAAWQIVTSRPGLVASLATAIYQVCFFAAVATTGVAVGTLVTVGSAPLLAGLLARVVNGTRPTRAWLAATMVCLVGLVLLAADGLAERRPLGVLLALAAGGCVAAYNVAAKRLFNRGEQALPVLAGPFVLGGLLLVPLLLVAPPSWILTPGGALLAAYLGVASMAVANLLLSYGLRRLAPGPVTTLQLADPVTATVLGVLVLGEVLSAPAWLGVGLLVAGLGLQGLSEARGRGPT